MEVTKSFNLQILLFVCMFLVLSPILFPLIQPGFPHSWDTEAHLARMAAFHKAILDGQIPPRWSSHLASGFGSPVLMFNWSLPYYLAEPLIFLGFSLTDAFKFILALGIVASFIAMYVFLREWLSKIPALAGAVLYIWAPYRFNTLYVRGAIGEATAFIFWPLLLWSIILSKGNKIKLSFLIGSFSFALLMLSHQAMFLMVLPLWASFVLLISWPTRNTKILITSVLSLCIGLTLSAFFWIPAYLERGSIGISSLGNLYSIHFSTLPSILSQPGFFTPKPTDFFLLYNLGWPQIEAFLGIIIITIAVCILKRSLRKAKIYCTSNFLFSGFFILGVFLLLPSSSALWSSIPLLSEILYPLRFLGLLTFISSILAALLISYATRNQILIGFLIIITAIIQNYSSLKVPSNRIIRSDLEYYRSESTTDMAGEFLPRWVDPDFYANPKLFRMDSPISIVSGNGHIMDPVIRSSSLSFTADATTQTTVVIGQFYFPGWSATANGLPMAVQMGKNGTMMLYLPAGISQVQVIYGSTFPRTVGVLLSLISIISIWVYLLLSFARMPSSVVPVAPGRRMEIAKDRGRGVH